MLFLCCFDAVLCCFMLFLCCFYAVFMLFCAVFVLFYAVFVLFLCCFVLFYAVLCCFCAVLCCFCAVFVLFCTVFRRIPAGLALRRSIQTVMMMVARCGSRRRSAQKRSVSSATLRCRLTAVAGKMKGRTTMGRGPS